MSTAFISLTWILCIYIYIYIYIYVLSAYRILYIVHSSIYSSNCPSYISASLVQRTSLPSLRNHASHLLSTPIIRPSKMNTRALSYNGRNSLPPYIRSIKSHKHIHEIYTTIYLRWEPEILILFVIIIVFINFRRIYSILFYYY